MRRGSRLAVAALAALALAAAGCDLVSSLTPFGLGERGPDPILGSYSGSWAGGTDTGGQVTFNVVSGEVTNLVLTQRLSCGKVEVFTFQDALLIADGTFSGTTAVEPQGKASITGRFTSRDSASGAYSFENLRAVPGCPTSGRGSFTAERATLINP